MGQQRLPRRPEIRAVRRQIDLPRPRRGRWRAWLAAGIAGAALAGAVFAYRSWPAVTGNAIVAIKHGTVEEAVLTDALVIRTEQVFKAPVSGRVTRQAAEGQRVRVGAPVVSITPGGAAGGAPAPDRSALADAVDQFSGRLYQLALTINQAKARGDSAEANRLQAELDATAARQWELARQLSQSQPAAAPSQTAPPSVAGGPGTPVTTEMAGVLVYQVDGLEEALHPANAANWKPSWFRMLAVPVLRRTGEGEVAAGEPVFKVVDNLSLGLLAVVPADALATLPPDGRVDLRFMGIEGLYQAQIARRQVEGAEVLLHLTAPVLPEELAGRRKVQVALVLATHTGKVVPRSAIDVREGLQGVWVLEEKAPAFRPIRVVGGNQQEVALETDFSIGTRIIRVAPQRMR